MRERNGLYLRSRQSDRAFCATPSAPECKGYECPPYKRIVVMGRLDPIGEGVRDQLAAPVAASPARAPNAFVKLANRCFRSRGCTIFSLTLCPAATGVPLRHAADRRRRSAVAADGGRFDIAAGGAFTRRFLTRHPFDDGASPRRAGKRIARDSLRAYQCALAEGYRSPISGPLRRSSIASHRLGRRRRPR